MATGSFDIAVESATPVDDVWKSFNLRDQETNDIRGTYWYTDPSEDELALYTMIFADGVSEANRIKATVDFFEIIMDQDSYVQMMEDIKDREKNWIHVSTLLPVLEGIVANVAGFPTRRSSGSTGSRARGGRTLTDHLPPKASTRSRSPRPVSVTSSTPG